MDGRLVDRVMWLSCALAGLMVTGWVAVRLPQQAPATLPDWAPYPGMGRPA